MRIGIALIAAALGLLVTLPSASRAEPREAVSANVAAMRGEFLIFGSLRLGGHWDGPEGPMLKLVSEVHPIVISSQLESAAKAYGVKPGQVEELLLGFSPPQAFVVVATLIDKTAADAFDGAMAPTDGLETIGEREFATDSKSGFAKSRLDPRVVQLGPTLALREIFGSKRPQVSNDVAADFLAASAKANILTLELPPSMLKSQIPVDVAKTPFGPLFDAKRWRVSIHADKGLKIVLRREFADEAGAKTGIEALSACLKGLDAVLQMGEEIMPEVFQRKRAEYPRGPEVEPIMKRAFQEIRKALVVAKPTVVGNAAEVTIDVETDRPVTTAVMLFTMLPRAKEEPAAKPAELPKNDK